MLPGFRFLFAAVMLSMSILVFGLGAAALLRTAHEEFASNPSWRAAPEVMFAQQPEAIRPVLAMLRVDNPVAEQAQDNAPATAAPTEQAAIAPMPAEAERVDALKPEDSIPAQGDNTEIVQPDVAVAENPAAAEPAPAPTKLPSAGEQIKIAATEAEKVSSREDQLVAPPENASVAPGAAIAPTKIATLGGPPVGVESSQPAKIIAAKPDPSAEKKRQQARRAAQRRRIAARARAAAQALAQPANPFSPPAPTAISAR